MKLNCKHIDFTYTPSEEFFTFPEDSGQPFLFNVEEELTDNPAAMDATLDEAVCGINDLQKEFDENDSEIETVAWECIGTTVAYILEWFDIPTDTEEAIRERDW